MTNTTDRRQFLQVASATLAVASLPTFVPTFGLSAKVRELRSAMAAFEAADGRREIFWTSCERAGIATDDGFWDWYVEQPVVRAAYAALRDVQTATESAFITPPQSHLDEDLIMQAMDVYELISPSAWAVQTARDLFTPARFQEYPLDGIREGLLTDPDEYFAKSPVPDFLWRMRAAHREINVS